MLIKKAVLKSFNPQSYTATVQLTSSHMAYLEGVTVTGNIESVHGCRP